MNRKIYSLFGNLVFHFFLALSLIGLDDEKVFGQSARVKESEPTASAPPPAPTLTLTDVIRQIEENHPKLSSATTTRRIAVAKLLEKSGAFDVKLNFNSDYLRYNSTSSPGKPSTARQNEFSVERTLRNGVKIFGGSRLNRGNVKSPLSSTGGLGEYFAGAALPLLRDWRVNEKSIAEQQAALGTGVADADFAQTRLNLILDGTNNYWNWAAAKQKLDVNRNLFELAKTRAEQVRARVQAGDLPPIDQTEAAQEVQRRMGNIVKAELDLQKSGLKLSQYLWDANGQFAVLPDPQQAPPQFAAPLNLSAQVVDLGVKRALRQRPELITLDLNLATSELDEQLARNNRRPNLDLYVAPGRDFGDKSIGATMKFGVNFSVPVQRREADGQLAQARLKQQKNQFETNIARQKIIAEIREAAASVNAAHDRILLAQQELDLTRALEQGERTRFAAGDSTLFLVNTRERATAEAEIKLIDLRAEYEQALGQFKFATVE